VTFLSTEFAVCFDEISNSNTPKVEFYLSQKLTFWKNRGTIRKKKKLLIIYKFCNFLKKNISSSFIDFCCSDDKTLQKMALIADIMPFFGSSHSYSLCVCRHI
jgi:hypothetical protein